MSDRPHVVLANPKGQCATFFWTDRPDFHIGYRMIEHQPQIIDQPLSGIDDQPSCELDEFPTQPDELLAAEQTDPWENGWSNSYTEQDPQNKVQFSFRAFADGAARGCGLDNEGKQERELFFRPTDSGVLMWMKMTTHVDLPGACAVQQCLRFSGATNQQWRRPIALIPFLSEFDIQAQGKPNDSLTWVRKDGDWMRLPVQHTRYHTPPGAPMLADTSDGEIPHGLIVRESMDQRYCSGMYWERTAYVSNRHPADCLHSSVDFAPLREGQSRTVHGKFYFLEDSKDKLLEMWRADFPVSNSDL